MVRQFEFDPERLREVTSRQRALYQSTMALLMRRGPRDFHDGAPLTRPIIEGRAVDDHHVFPRAWLAANGHDDLPDTILNHTLIGKITNIVISGRAPSSYLAALRAGRAPSLRASPSRRRAGDGGVDRVGRAFGASPGSL